jgi:hypothetical protein
MRPGGRTDRQASTPEEGEQRGREHAAAAHQHQRIRLHAPGRVELPDRAHRGERGDRERAHHRQCRAAEDRDRSRQPGSECRLAAGGSDGAQPRQVRRGPVQQLRQGLARQHEQGQRCQPAEHGQRDRLWLDPLLHLVVNDVQAADVEADRARRHVEHPVHHVGDRGQAPLQRRDAGAARREAQPDPPECELAVQVPGGGRRGQDGVIHLVELVPEHRGKVHDAGDQEREPTGRDQGVRRQVPTVKLIGHVAAHAGVEELGLARRECDLVGGAGPGQPARQHCHPVLPETVPVEAAGQAVGEPAVVDLAVHDRVGVQAYGGGG